MTNALLTVDLNAETGAIDAITVKEIETNLVDGDHGRVLKSAAFREDAAQVAIDCSVHLVVHRVDGV